MSETKVYCPYIQLAVSRLYTGTWHHSGLEPRLGSCMMAAGGIPQFSSKIILDNRMIIKFIISQTLNIAPKISKIPLPLSVLR